MPIHYRIDHRRRLVIAVGLGTFTDRDVFEYQLDVWGRPDVSGYNELVDMTRVTEIEVPSKDQMMDLAAISAEMDDRSTLSRFAIVAPEDIAFKLGKLFQSNRGLQKGSRKEVGVFRTLEQALTFLAIEGPLDMPPVL